MVQRIITYIFSINIYRTPDPTVFGGSSTPTPTPVATPTPVHGTPKPPLRPTPTPRLTPVPTPSPDPPTPVPSHKIEPKDFAFASSDTKIGDVIELLPPIKLSPNVSANIPYVPSTDCTVFNINVDDEKLDRILMMYNYILSGKGSDIVTYGIYDKDWYVVDSEAFIQSTQALSGRPNYAWDLYGVIKGLNGDPDVPIGCQDIFTYASFYPEAFTPLFSNKSDNSITQMSQKQDALLNASTKAMSSDSVIKSILCNYIGKKTIQDIIDAKNKPYEDAKAAYEASGIDDLLYNAIFRLSTCLK